jgi:tRNA-Thr(GGU) m(6)t(6)A37 methyltransferase TsaA
MNEVRYKPIGIIHSAFKETEGLPIQSIAAPDVEGLVEILPEYSQGLRDIEGFSHIFLIYHFHKARRPQLMVKPYLDDHLHGVFATRAPVRPNPIGISIVRLVTVEENKLHIKDVDVVDGTPLLDIKPYVPEFDARETDRIGWLKNRINRLAETKSDDRFVRGESGGNCI